MAFQPSASDFSKTRVFVILVALAATACLGAYHLRRAETADTFARPSPAAVREGPVLLEGRAGGTPFALPDGSSVLLAQIEVRDRAPGQKGSNIVCTRVLVERLTIDGKTVVWDPSATTATSRPPIFGGGHVGYLDLSREGAALPLSAIGAYCDAEAMATARHVAVRTLLPGDVATVTGCARHGDVVACHDGQDLLSGRSGSEAAGKMREGLAVFLILATLLGCPSLVALIILLSQRTASVARPARAAVS